MAPLSNLFLLLALSSGKVFANPTAARLGDLLSIVSIDVAPLVTEIVTTTKTYPATAPTSYTSSTYDTDCQCYYSTIFWWTPHPQPYPTTTPHTTKPASTVTVTKTTTVATTTTVTATATVTAPCTPSLSCDKYGYLIQNVTLFQVDLSTGKFSQIANHIGNDKDVNAIAYNTLDNLLYARQGAEIVRIGSDGTVESVATSPSGSGGNVGDIDTDGYYWYGSSGSVWYQLDLRPGSATYGTLLSNGTADTLGLSIADWAYIPVGGSYMYTAARNPASIGGTSLARFSLDTKQWEIVQRYPRIGGNTWGAVYGINNGTLYASDNTNGQIWAFPIGGGSPYLASQGPVSPGLNDGARCVLNLDVN